jgi:hypothetical protein
MNADPSSEAKAERLDRLLDAIELVNSNRRAEAQAILRELIREDSDFEAAWMWMSVAVDTLDQASICLENVLRINPKNQVAAGALYHTRLSELQMENRRGELRFLRDMAQSVTWMLIFIAMSLMTASLCNAIVLSTAFMD